MKGEHAANVQEQPAVDDTAQQEAVDSELVRTLREQISDSKADEQYYQTQIANFTNRLEALRKQNNPNPIVRWWRGLG